MIVSMNAGFTTVNNCQLKKLMQKAYPWYEMPDRHDVGGKFLDEIYAEERDKVRLKVKDQVATIAIDGWSTIQNCPVIGVCIYTTG